MNTPNANPIVAATRVKRGPEGQPKGSAATSPKEIDAIIREVYGKIYKGNVADHEKVDYQIHEEVREVHLQREASNDGKPNRGRLATDCKGDQRNGSRFRPAGPCRHEDAIIENLRIPCRYAK